MTQYVVGFLFDNERQLVALIEKQKPEWQKGYLNGIGGKIEPSDKDASAAMVREFYEEAGVETLANGWRKFAVMNGKDWSVDCFVQFSSGAISKVISATNEQIHIIHVSAISHHKTLSNIPWLVHMALDENMGNPPFFATIEY